MQTTLFIQCVRRQIKQGLVVNMATRVDEVQAQGEVSHGEVISKSGNATVEVTESVITLLRWRAACKGWLTRVTKQML